ncbi:MAG: cation:proton antiporter [Anaerolineaceae bacterium]|nr:cation:proton antiporter [Anaerolineaceae bacterium]
MTGIVLLGTQAALLVLVILIIPCAYRAWVGPTAPDRLQAIDSITTLLIGIIIVLALLRSTAMFIDVAIALAAFAFIGTVALARYISEGRAF